MTKTKIAHTKKEHQAPGETPRGAGGGRRVLSAEVVRAREFRRALGTLVDAPLSSVQREACDRLAVSLLRMHEQGEAAPPRLRVIRGGASVPANWVTP